MSSKLKDKRYLESIFPDIYKIEGIILKLNVDIGYNNYIAKFGDPLKINTLILADTDNSVIIIFKTDKRSIVRHMTKEVIVMKSYSYDNDTIILKRVSPEPVPTELEKHIFDINPSDIIKQFEGLTVKPSIQDFLDKYYVEGGMASFRQMKALPEWIEEWRNHLEIKAVQMCRSCGKRAIKGCCDKYKATNRKTIFMVIGWTEKEI